MVVTGNPYLSCIAILMIYKKNCLKISLILKIDIPINYLNWNYACKWDWKLLFYEPSDFLSKKHRHSNNFLWWPTTGSKI